MRKTTRTIRLCTALRRPASVLALGALVAAPPVASQIVTTGNHRIHQSDLGGLVEAGDRFGAQLASGDFNRDGYWDLAIAAPGENIGATSDAGAVFVVYGAAAGLGQGAPAPLTLYQDVAGVQDVSEADDLFGAALAVGDVNGDGYDDLAVGIPGEGIAAGGGGTYVQAGAVQVFLSSVGGVVAAADSFIYGDSIGSGTYDSNSFEEFGGALASCDFNRDGKDEILVGVPGHMRLAQADTGTVLTLFGSAGGTTTAGALYWAPSDADGGDRFGSSIACGDVDGIGVLDIVAGGPHAQIGSGGADSGAAWLLANSLFSFGGNQAGARMGSAVAVGNFKGGGRDLILLGVPGFDPASQDEAGVANTWDPLNPGLPFVTQGVSPLGDAAEPFDHFGAVLAAGDFNHDGFADGVFGVPDENLHDGMVNQKLDAGKVQIVFGTASGLVGGGSQSLDWDLIGFGALANDHFGSALAVGDFDGNGVDDLAIGVPDALWDGQAQTGIVQIFYGWPPGWIFGDGFESGDTRKWGP